MAYINILDNGEPPDALSDEDALLCLLLLYFTMELGNFLHCVKRDIEHKTERSPENHLDRLRGLGIKSIVLSSLHQFGTHNTSVAQRI